MKYKFKCCAEQQQKDNLEALFFFNNEQFLITNKIENILDKYGYPQIIENDGKVWIELKNLMDCQNLLITNKETNEVMGIMLHARTTNEEAEIIHIAVNNIKSEENIVDIMYREVCRIYKNIKDIRYLSIAYINKRIKIR